MAPIFELSNVNKQFGQLPVLQNINLSIETGERVALVGPSGAGKSTLLSLLNGSLQADSGRIRLLGREVTALSTAERRQLQQQIGTVYQQYRLVENLRVIHNVNAGRLGRWPLWKAVWSLFRPLEKDSAYEALRQVGIPEKLYERTAQLSGGQQQRVAIARVLVQNPEAILADEPIASLDPERGREVMALLGRLALERGKTLLISLHPITFALSHCERIIGLRHGRILFDKPAAQITDEMIAALYRLEPTAAEQRY